MHSECTESDVDEPDDAMSTLHLNFVDVVLAMNGASVFASLNSSAVAGGPLDACRQTSGTEFVKASCSCSSKILHELAAALKSAGYSATRASLSGAPLVPVAHAPLDASLSPTKDIVLEFFRGSATTTDACSQGQSVDLLAAVGTLPMSTSSSIISALGSEASLVEAPFVTVIAESHDASSDANGHDEGNPLLKTVRFTMQRILLGFEDSACSHVRLCTVSAETYVFRTPSVSHYHCCGCQ